MRMVTGRVNLPRARLPGLRERPVADLERLPNGQAMPPRALDVSVAALGLVALSPLLALIALAVRLTSPGPVLFTQERVGLHGRPFRIMKFRTMVADAGERGGQLTVGERDPRVTRVGALLRATKLDELPQLWNVVRGDMRLVGPRPEVPRYVDRYTPAQRALLAVRPGITDPASLAFRHESRLLANAPDPERLYVEDIMPRKLAINAQYLARRTLATDLRVVVSTVLLAVMRLNDKPRRGE